MKTQYLCLPLMRPTTATATATATTTSTTPTSSNRRVGSPVTGNLMDRFREAVFRLIMVTAITKNTNNNNSTSSRSPRGEHKDDHNKSVRRSSCYVHDPYPSEAVADCIEFIKKKAASPSLSDHEHDEHSSSTHDSSVDTDIVIPLPVM